MSQMTRKLITAVALVALTSAAAVTVFIEIPMANPGAVTPQNVAKDDVNALTTPSGVTQPGLPGRQSVEPSPTEGTKGLQPIPSPSPVLNGPVLTPVASPTARIDGLESIPSPIPESGESPMALMVPSPAATATMVGGSLQIPSIGVSAEIVPVGITEAGNMAVPSSPWGVGWYRFGARPGEPGKVVLAGHVDSQEGPAVFWNLNELQPGDRIEIENGDGTIHTYIVTGSAVYRTNDAPVNEIFGSHGRPELVLVTCDGTFDHSTRSYDQRLVVYAETGMSSS